jgi:4-amino-4-deoxy-L-arabinose transferase-like glycosyltransferase
VTAAEARLQPLSRAGHRRPTNPTRGLPRALAAVPVAAILVMQAVMSFRLAHTGVASADEGLYIYSGHQLIQELWHGGGSPYYETWFSGAPVIYPVLAAMVDHVGGLVLVRLTSGLFILAATCLLYAVTRRIFGYWPAVSAAGLFASLSITQFLSAYATYDAMALMLMSAAVFCGVKAAVDRGTCWLLLIPIVLLLANATKYASVLFDPVVIALAALMVRERGWRRVLHRAAVLMCSSATLLIIAALLAGSSYLKGILGTTLDRSGTAYFQVPAAPHTVLVRSWGWIGAIVCLGCIAAIISVVQRRERPHLALIIVLIVAGTLVTIENMRLHSLTAVSKHDDFGAWFTCIAAGYALARCAELARSRIIRLPLIATAICGVLGVAVFYGSQATTFFARPERIIPRIAAIQPYVKPGSQHYLLSYATPMTYYLHPTLSWTQVVEHNYIRYPVPGRPGTFLYGKPGFRAAIGHHWFAVISFPSPSIDPWDDWEQIEFNAVRTTPGYLLISKAGGPTYIYVPDFSNGGTG